MIIQRISDISERITQAALNSHRTPSEITLVAVSKQKSVEDILAAYEAGIRHFGENRIEELENKAVQLAHLKDIQWHFIGRLQSRQSETVARYASCFHALDRIKIAHRLSSHLVSLHKTLPVFIQVNVSGEKSKAGFECSDWEQHPQQGQELATAITEIAQLPALEIRGLMTMAPWEVEGPDLRLIFQRTFKLCVWLKNTLRCPLGSELSMGMSHDFEMAIEEGSTCVRIGSSIFGMRSSE